MTGDHPTDWATRHVKAAALREAAADLDADDRSTTPQIEDHALWLRRRADELDQR